MAAEEKNEIEDLGEIWESGMRKGKIKKIA